MPEVSKVPVHTVVLSRDSGKKNPKGEPIFTRLSPQIGKPFSFTKEEAEQIMKTNPLALRDPKDETELPKKVQEAVEEAQSQAQEAETAAGDAASVMATAAKGKKGQKVAGTPTPEGDAMIHEDDSDTL